MHAYARHFPVFDEKAYTGEDAYTDPPATVHFTTGAAGNPEMLVGDAPPPLGRCRRARRTLLAVGSLCGVLTARALPGCLRSAPWCAFQAGYAPAKGQSADYSYSRVTLANATHLRWEQVSASYGRVVDDTWIVRTRGAPAFGAAAAAHGAAAATRVLG